ncbi:DUF6081 family protein [Nocardia transvalensis]|uniref:DUF6081 family protein n=1 Tax=Nocardia transvalensis TaxID=37333 RepID=UPI001894BF6E|nr:DUF6081 family protein [Nocardia transvalensis]MBF6328264.1 hypothetical protein [Nocardia transvalensis]
MTATNSGTDTRTRRVLFSDTFSDGLSVAGPGARWQLQAVGSLPEGDGVVHRTEDGVVIDSIGVEPVTGEPCFSVQPDARDEHIKWRAIPAATSSAGVPGFDVGRRDALSVTADMTARIFGVDRHPFGRAVADPDNDLRLAAAALIAADLVTGMIFNLSLTNRGLFALYERLPGTGPASGRYSFSSSTKIGERTPERVHRLGISYDRASGTVDWLVDGAVALRVDRLGYRNPALDIVIDRGGIETPADPAQLLVGVCSYTLLDASGPAGPLVTGAEPYPPTWGQGVRIGLRRFEVVLGAGA